MTHNPKVKHARRPPKRTGESPELPSEVWAPHSDISVLRGRRVATMAGVR